MKEASGKRGGIRDVELADVGEDRLIAELTRNLRHNSRVKIGPGDDCAVVKFGKRWQLLKTECIVESIHFLKESPATWVGWKALCRAISDVAAMGGKPMDALVTIAVAPQVRLRWVRGVYSGLRKAAQRYEVNLVGGETSRSPGPAFISVALTGIVEKRRALLRSGGRPGDFLYVTGQLGGSIRGKHLRFEPRLAEALWLADHFVINAMIDLSDGLGSELPRLAKASSTGFEIEREHLLVFAVSPGAAPTLEERWNKRFPTLALTHIGRLTEPSAQKLHAPGIDQLTDSGYDHFRVAEKK